MSGTCLYAAAWNTTVGLNLEKTACTRAGLRASPMMGAMSGLFFDDRNSCSMLYKAYSFSSNRTRRSGSNFAIWRASSEPIEPPAPVTITTLPVRSRCSPPSSSTT